ncbi:MAG: hypothetical protein J6A59_09740 [Lachnospiraceae bacterium]|nr:hypothetical protein [Lachnospiraceae bacterium]
MKNASEIRKAKKYADLFSNDDAVAKKEFRYYCKLYHPDVDDSAEAAELFAIIHELYTNKVIKSTLNSSIKDTIVFRNKDTGKGFELKNYFKFNNGIAMIYHTATKVAIVYDKTYRKFYDNYLKMVKSLKYADLSMEKEFKRYFPKLVTNFETEDGQFLILLDKTSEVLNLGVIVKSYENRGEKFPERHAAWILNRLYNIECYLNYNNLVSNGISIDNIWVSPEMHTVLLFNGWEYTTEKDAGMLGCPKEVYKVLPVKVKGTKQSNTLTDLESIKNTGRKLFKGHDKLEYVNKFLNSGIDSDEPLNEWDKYGEAINKQFGKRTFIIWDDVPYNT